MAKYFTVEGCTLKLREGLTASPIEITNSASTIVKINGKGVYAKKIEFKVSNYTGTTITDGNGEGVGTITATSLNNKVDGDAVILEGDESAIFTLVGTSGGNPAEDTDTVYVQSAGQNLVKGT